MNSKIFFNHFQYYSVFMKYLWLFFILVFLFSCKSKQSILVENTNTHVSANCPEDGRCSFEIFQNKDLHFLKDNLGMLYPEIVNGNQLVLKFKYEKNTDLKAVDGHYIEEVFIELDPKNLLKETTQFKSEKLLFSRLCFCRGQTGYYQIRNGNLSLQRIKGNAYQISLHFKIDEVPQVITTFTEIFSLK